MSGFDIQAEVAAAIRGLGVEVGDGTFEAVITRAGPTTGDEWNPTPGTPVTYNVAVIDSNINVRDAAGTLVGEMRRRLTIEAGVVVPLKGDAITVRGVNYTVDTVDTLAPLGVDLLYKVTLEVGPYVAPIPPIVEPPTGFAFDGGFDAGFEIATE